MESAMMRKYLIPLIALALGAGAAIVYSDIIFDVDFENPPHVAGSPPVTGSSVNQPTGISGSWDIATGVADFSSQVALLDSTSGGMGFVPSDVYTTGIHIFRWEYALVTVDSSQGQLQTSVMFINDGMSRPAQEVIISYLDDGTLNISDPLNGGTGVSNWLLNQSATYALTIDLDSQTYGFTVDAQPIVTDTPLNPGAFLTGMSFQTPFNMPSYGLDNFQWQIIPEPTTLGLMLVALGALGLRVFRC
ncbi:MAG: PEP-CTERM sorting domain-containing protein [Spartobacteria bacterium]|nr:PEP-CTERM sorting domain-containing protein [Spartobacteria bacterium]